MSFLSKFCQFIGIWFSTWVSNHIQWVLHCLGCSFKQNVTLFLLVINFKILKHFGFLLIKHFLSLFINHLAWTASFFIVVNCWESLLLWWDVIEGRWRRLVVDPKSYADSFIPTLFLLVFFLCTFIAFILLGTVFSLNFSWRIVFQSCPWLFHQVVNMKVVKLPSNVVNSSKYVKTIVEVCHCVSASNSWYIACCWEKLIFESLQVKKPEIVVSGIFVLTTKNVNVLAVSCTRKSAWWFHDVWIRLKLTLFCGVVFKNYWDFILRRYEFINCIGHFSFFIVVSSNDVNCLLSFFLKQNAFEWVDFWHVLQSLRG